MYKANKETRLLIRFLREKGIKYTYVEEALQFAYIKKYERKEFSRFISDEVDGNLLVEKGALLIAKEIIAYTV